MNALDVVGLGEDVVEGGELGVRVLDQEQVHYTRTHK